MFRPACRVVSVIWSVVCLSYIVTDMERREGSSRQKRTQQHIVLRVLSAGSSYEQQQVTDTSIYANSSIPFCRLHSLCMTLIKLNKRRSVGCKQKNAPVFTHRADAAAAAAAAATCVCCSLLVDAADRKERQRTKNSCMLCT